jgi:alpha-L-fucosidase
MKKLLVIAFLSCLAFNSSSQSKVTPENKADRMQWFQDAKLGIFIHWGIYAVNGIDESWSFFNEYLPYEEYMEQRNGFTAENYDPDEWAKLIRDSGAKYAVLTSKHHDGMALWDTKQSNLSMIQQTPAGRDLIAPYCKSLRKEGLKVGLYYSLCDWSHPDYPNFTRTQKRYTDDPARWDQFTEFNFGQISEILTLYNPDLIWFDGDWEQSAEKWKAEEIRKMILENNSGAIINSRLQGYGDYATPEHSIPLSRPKADYWELCMTTNDSWGFQGRDTNYKPANLIIRVFADVIGNGGNLLLDIGPKADGSIPQEQIDILKSLGRWTEKHEEAIYGTLGGLPKDCYYGPSTISEDSSIIYLFVSSMGLGEKVEGWKGGKDIDSLTHGHIDALTWQIILKGMLTPVKSVRVVGHATELHHKTWMKPWWSSHAGLITIDIPIEKMDEDMTVIAAELEGKIELEL